MKKKYTQRRRATAKRQPIPALRNPKPHIPAPWAPPVNPIPDAEWYDEFEDFGGDVPPVTRSNVVSYWILAFAIVLAAVALFPIAANLLF